MTFPREFELSMKILREHRLSYCLEQAFSPIHLPSGVVLVPSVTYQGNWLLLGRYGNGTSG